MRSLPAARSKQRRGGIATISIPYCTHEGQRSCRLEARDRRVKVCRAWSVTPRRYDKGSCREDVIVLALNIIAVQVDAQVIRSGAQIQLDIKVARRPFSRRQRERRT